MTAEGDASDRDPGEEPSGYAPHDEPSEDGSSDDPPTLGELFGRLATAVGSRPPVELALVALPLPLLLVAVSLSPGTAAWRLSLSAEGVLESRWTLWTAFASSFVHTTTGHLVDNVVNYWLLVAVAYPLSVIAGWRRRLLYASATYLAVVPLVSAWATIVALGGLTNAPTAGFSDVNSAFLGYLVVVWFAALATETDRRDGAANGELGGSSGVDGGSGVGGDSEVDGGSGVGGGSEEREITGDPVPGVDPRWAIVAVLASLSAVYLTPSGVGYFPALPAVGSVLAFGAGLVALGLHALVGRPRIVGIGLDPSRELLYVTSASVAAAGVIGSLIVVPFGSNVHAHLAGYVVGVLVPFVGVLFDDV